MKKIFVCALGICLSGSLALAKPTAISDSLVNNLSCSGLSVNAIFSKLRPDAYAHNNHMPLRNWGFRSGITNIAACWGMSSTQRKLFYLMRLNEKNAPAPNLVNVLDMVRGASLNGAQTYVQNQPEIQTEAELMKLKEQPLTSYNVIPVSEQSLREEFYHNTGTSFMDRLFKGIEDRQGSDTFHRDLRTEIERSQERHFFRSENLDMGMGSGPRSVQINRQTIADLIKNMNNRRLTLINLRLKMRVQHIVIPKSYIQDVKGNVWITAYDSNQPETDHRIYYSRDTGHFYSPEIMGSFVNDRAGTDFSHPLGVFIVDELERTQIEASLLRHYQKRCQ